MEKELKTRTKKFALEVLKLVDVLPNKRSANIVGNQLGRSATSVAANYRAACKGRFHADFISKFGIVEEEADESILWIELLDELGHVPANSMASLLKESSELTAIFTASGRTAKTRHSFYANKKDRKPNE
jgi:four helix bundle protein